MNGTTKNNAKTFGQFALLLRHLYIFIEWKRSKFIEKVWGDQVSLTLVTSNFETSKLWTNYLYALVGLECRRPV